MRSKTWEVLNSKSVSALIRYAGIVFVGTRIMREQHERRMHELNTRADYHRRVLEAAFKRKNESLRLAEQVIGQEHTSDFRSRK